MQPSEELTAELACCPSDTLAITIDRAALAVNVCFPDATCLRSGRRSEAALAGDAVTAERRKQVSCAVL